MKYKLIVFDWSGTLSDDRLPVYNTNNLLLERYGKPAITFDEWLNADCGNIVEFYHKYQLITSEGTMLSSEDILFEYRKTYKHVFDNVIKTNAYPHLHDLLSAIKKDDVILCIVSSHPKSQILIEMASYNLDSSIFDTIIGESINKTKDLIEMCKKYNIDAESSVYIGDCCQDVVHCKRARYKTHISITHGYHSRDKLTIMNPDLIVDDLKELTKILC
jgi:phosphoglycolate phosphatase-like HAD superfamily hydrolase